MTAKLCNLKLVSARLFVTLICISALAPNSNCVEISNFTGGDPGEGLDLEGKFAYAVNISGFGGQTIGDVEFTEDFDTDGFDIISTHDLPTWATPEYGDTDADDQLEEIMQSIRWSNVPTDQPTVDIEMSVESGQSYKMQMLFTESCCDRAFDIFLDEELLVDDFAIYEHHSDDVWDIADREDGVLITHEFTAASDLLFLQLGTEAEDFPDNNGHISALTLEIASAGVAGDFNNSGMRDPADFDLLAAGVTSGDAAFDLDGDGDADNEDRRVWVEDLSNTHFGDSNWDGEFSSADFVTVFSSAKYETGNPSRLGGWRLERRRTF